MLKRYLLPLAGGIAALYPVAVQAQARAHNLPGYVVTLRGDTLRGTLEVPTFPTEAGLKLFAGPQAAAQRFGVREVRAFGLQDGRRFVTRQLAAGQDPETGRVDSATVFLQHLVGGAANFYRYDFDATSYRERDHARAETVQYFVSLAGGNLVSVKRLTYQTVLPAVFKDCPAVVNALSRTIFSEDRLSDLVLRYNAECHAATAARDLRPHRVPNPVQVRVSLRGGLQRSQLYYPTFSFLQRDDVPAVTMPTYAAEFRFSRKGPWSISTGVQYARLRGQASAVQPAQLGTSNAGQPLVLPFTVETQNVQIPLLLRYTFGHGLWRPYLVAGALFGKYYNTKTVLSYTTLTYVGGATTYRNDLVVEATNDNTQSPFIGSAALRLGLQVKTKLRVSPLLEIQYSGGMDDEVHPGVLRVGGQVEQIGHLQYRALSFVAGLEF